MPRRRGGWTICAGAGAGAGAAEAEAAAASTCAAVHTRAVATVAGEYLANELSQDVSPEEIAGETPEEIDQVSRDKGLNPQGPDPMSGKGAYTDPVTGKQRVLCHTNCNFPHAHVNNPQGEHLDINGNIFEPESPDTHLPVNY